MKEQEREVIFKDAENIEDEPFCIKTVITPVGMPVIVYSKCPFCDDLNVRAGHDQIIIHYRKNSLKLTAEQMASLPEEACVNPDCQAKKS